ncbi:MAG: exodeoxyribonuclease VII small subunit [Duncaniella sp.]|nr:exodeoxyribonuclease VII small subunit [Duncaniella sp.]
MEEPTSFTPIDTLTYSQCVAELESIVRMMQSDRCDIDRLADYTRRATELLGECRGRLTTTEERLRDTLASLRQE